MRAHALVGVVLSIVRLWRLKLGKNHPAALRMGTLITRAFAHCLPIVVSIIDMLVPAKRTRLANSTIGGHAWLKNVPAICLVSRPTGNERIETPTTSLVRAFV